jgi:hypothetical protein
MSKVEMLCWAILAMQAVLTCVGGFIADKIHQIWHIAMKAAHEPREWTDGESMLARARFQDSINELDRTIDKTFHMGPPKN